MGRMLPAVLAVLCLASPGWAEEEEVCRFGGGFDMSRVEATGFTASIEPPNLRLKAPADAEKLWATVNPPGEAWDLSRHEHLAVDVRNEGLKTERRAIYNTLSVLTTEQINA